MKTETSIVWNKIKLREKGYIEVPTPFGDLDLHAFAIFSELRLDVEKNQLFLRFTPWKQNEFQVPSGGGNILLGVDLLFRDVCHFYVEKSDEGIPVEENTRLEYYIVLEKKEDEVSLMFVFNSEREITIVAKEVKVILHSKEGLKKTGQADLELV